MTDSFAILPLLLAFALAGCASKGKPPSGLPNGVVSGSPPIRGPMAFDAPDNGTLFIRDETAGRVIFSALVAYRDRVALLPDTKQVVVKGNSTQQPDLDPKHYHRFYFLKG